MYCLQVEQLDRTRRKESMRKRLPAKRNESVILGSTDAKFYFSSGLLEHSQLGICRLFHNEGRAGGGKGKTYFAISSLRFFLPASLDTGLPRGNVHERAEVPCEVPSLPNPTTRKGWPHHWGLRPLLFSNSGVSSFTSHMNTVKVL